MMINDYLVNGSIECWYFVYLIKMHYVRNAEVHTSDGE